MINRHLTSHCTEARNSYIHHARVALILVAPALDEFGRWAEHIRDFGV